MAATTIQGVGGAYSPASGFNLKASVWSATVNITTQEDTGFTDNGWESHNAVKIGLSGTASGTGQYDGSSTAPLNSSLMASTAGLSNAKASCTLTAFTGCTLGFTAVMQQVGLNRPNDGKLDVSHQFVSSGAVTQTWDETS